MRVSTRPGNNGLGYFCQISANNLSAYHYSRIILDTSTICGQKRRLKTAFVFNILDKQNCTKMDEFG